MKIQVKINGTDVSRYLIKGGAKLTVSWEDRDRTRTISVGNLAFSNLTGAFDWMLNIASNMFLCEIYYSNVLYFVGYLRADSVSYELANKTIYCEIISHERDFIDRLKATTMFGNDAVTRLGLEGTAYPQTTYMNFVGQEKYAYFLIDYIFDLMATTGGIYDSSGFEFASSLYFGGVLLDGNGYPPVDAPEMTCYDFCQGISNLFNAVWWLTPDRRHFYWGRKASVLKSAKIATALNLPSRKGTTKLSKSVTGIRSAVVKCGTKTGYVATVIGQDTRPGEDFKADVPFTLYEVNGERDGKNLLWMNNEAAADTSRLMQETVSGAYSFETKTGDMVETELSFLNNDSAVQRIFAEPYIKLWDTNTSPKGITAGKDYFLTKAEIDFRECTAKIIAKGYTV